MTSEKTKYRILNALRASAPLRAWRDEVCATATGVAYYLHGHLVASKTPRQTARAVRAHISRMAYGYNRQPIASVRL